MKTILFISYIDFGDYASGSSVRPQKMYEAFEKLGCRMILLQTQQNKRAERKKAVQKIMKRLDKDKPDLCYVESPSGPIFNACDWELLKKVHEKKIPIAYFYRDAAYLFPEIFHRQGFLQTVKERVIAKMSKNDVKNLKKYADVVYLPTKSMSDYFDFTNVKFLPPACLGSCQNHKNGPKENRSIYVGGLSERYGTLTMLRAFHHLNKKGSYPLTIVCRPKEAAFIPQAYKKAPWLSVCHASGEKLWPIYQEADAAMYPIQKNVYNDFAFSVKIPEYLQAGLPIVAVNCKETEKFITETKTGIVCKDNPMDFAKAVEKFFSDRERYKVYAENACEAAEKNTWTARTEKVMRDFNITEGEDQ